MKPGPKSLLFIFRNKNRGIRSGSSDPDYMTNDGLFYTYSMKQPDLYYFEAIKMTSSA